MNLSTEKNWSNMRRKWQHWTKKSISLKIFIKPFYKTKPEVLKVAEAIDKIIWFSANENHMSLREWYRNNFLLITYRNWSKYWNKKYEKKREKIYAISYIYFLNLIKLKCHGLSLIYVSLSFLLSPILISLLDFDSTYSWRFTFWLFTLYYSSSFIMKAALAMFLAFLNTNT